MKRYYQALQDYDYLVEHHGYEPYGITGGFEEGNHFMRLLRNPTKKQAYESLCSLIEYTATSGFEPDGASLNRILPDMNDPRTVQIYTDYGCIDSVRRD